jgi:hypothetical protein
VPGCLSVLVSIWGLDGINSVDISLGLFELILFAHMTPQKVAQQFVTAINAHDVECLATS